MRLDMVLHQNSVNFVNSVKTLTFPYVIPVKAGIHLHPHKKNPTAYSLKAYLASSPRTWRRYAAGEHPIRRVKTRWNWG